MGYNFIKMFDFNFNLKGGPLINIYTEFIKSNKLNLQKHATGMPGFGQKRTAIEPNAYYAALVVVSITHNFFIINQ